MVEAAPAAAVAPAPAVVETYEAAAVPAVHQAALPAVVAGPTETVQPIVTPQVAYSYLPYATQYRYLLEPGEWGHLI